MTKVFAVQVELILKGDEEEQVFDAAAELLDGTFGNKNYTIYEVKELTQDQIIELENGIHEEGDDEDDEVVGVTVHDVEIIEPSIEIELDEMDIRRDELVSDELGS